MAVTADMVERPGGKARHISYTLPAWTYNNAEFFDLEREHNFMRAGQLVCHVSEVAESGDCATLDLSGERAFVIRGQDGRPRAAIPPAFSARGRPASSSSTTAFAPSYRSQVVLNRPSPARWPGSTANAPCDNPALSDGS